MEIKIEISDEKLRKIIKSASEDLFGQKYDDKDFEKIKSEMMKKASKELLDNMRDIAQYAIDKIYR